MLTDQQIDEVPTIIGNLKLSHFLRQKYPHTNINKLVKRCSELYTRLIKDQIKTEKIDTENFDSFNYYNPQYKFIIIGDISFLLILSPFGGYMRLGIEYD